MPNEVTCEKAAFGIGNLALYRMCDGWPSHNDADHVQNKLIYISRVYSVSRNLGAQWESITASILNIGKELDAKLDALRTSKFPECRQATIEAHALFDKAVCTALINAGLDGKDGKSVRGRPSLASKYLHFHAPDAIPILDSLAWAGLQSLTPRYRSGLKPEAPIYLRFTKRLEDFVASSSEWQSKSLREIDTDLVKIGRQKARKAEHLI